MGLFLAMSAVVGATESLVEAALRDYFESNGEVLEKEPLCRDAENSIVVSESAGGVTVLYPADFLDWDDAAQHLSHRVGRPVFSFHIHDGDFWMYVLFENGEVVDRFNPLPDYWQTVDDDERVAWQGDTTKIIQRIPSLEPNQIANYLQQWDIEAYGSDARIKAYPTDQFYYGDDWQLIDFMRKLDFTYPIDDQGEPRGATSFRIMKKS